MSPGDPGSKPPASAVAPQPSPSAAPAPGATDATDDQALTAFSTRFLAAYLERDPVQATAAGEHRHDGRYPDVSAEGEAEHHRFLEGALKELDAIPVTRLSVQSRVDHAILANQLRGWLFDLDELHEHVWNPMTYTTLIGEGIDPLITRSFAPADVRMRSLRGRLDGIPALVAVAKKRLTGSPEIHTKLRDQLQKRSQQLEKSIAGKESRLASADYIARAPAAQVQETRELLASEQAELANVVETIAGL